MSIQNTRTFLIDDSDKELFIMMKSLVDTNFPDEMWERLYRELWKRHRRYEVKERGNTVYISFPKISPFVRLLGWLLLKLNKDEECDCEDCKE